MYRSENRLKTCACVWQINRVSFTFVFTFIYPICSRQISRFVVSAALFDTSILPTNWASWKWHYIKGISYSRTVVPVPFNYLTLETLWTTLYFVEATNGNVLSHPGRYFRSRYRTRLERQENYEKPVEFQATAAILFGKSDSCTDLVWPLFRLKNKRVRLISRVPSFNPLTVSRGTLIRCTILGMEVPSSLKQPFSQEFRWSQ